MRAIAVLVLCVVPGVSGNCASLGGHWYDSASDDVMSVMESGCVLQSKYGQVSVSGRNVEPVKGLWKTLGVTGELDGMQSTIAWSNGVTWSKASEGGSSSPDLSALLTRIEALEAKTTMLEQELASVVACTGCSSSVSVPTTPVSPGTTTANVSNDVIAELQRQVQNLTEVVGNGGIDGKNGYCTIQPNVTSVYIPVTRYVYRRYGSSANKCTMGGLANRGVSATATTPTMMTVGTVDTNCAWTTQMSEDPIYAYKGDTLVFWRNGRTTYSVSQFETEEQYINCDFSRSTLLAGLIDFSGLEKAGKNFTMTLSEPGNYYFGSIKSGVIGDASKSYCESNVKVHVIVLDPVYEVLAECPLYDPSLYGVSGTTDAADSETVQKLKGAVAAMGRQLVAVEQRTAERVREQGQSGVTIVRAWNQGTDAYYGTTYAQGGAANMHNHANLHHTIGLGEFGAVLNGVQFTTRHNDYSLLEPDDSLTVDEYKSSWPPKSKNIEQPPVPPSVLNAGSVNAQLTEMREYFRAFHTQNLTHRDYRPYFQAVMCYLEGTWTEAVSSVAEPFASERHHIDAESWTELTQKTNFLFNNGQKNNAENLPFLPTSFRGMKEDGDDTFEPIMAQWFYRITCKKLEEHLPTTALRVRNDVHLQMAEYHPATRETLSQTARAVFEIHPKGGGTWPKGKTTWEFLDDLMYNISGLDGPNADLVDNSFGATCGTYQDGSVLNTARYSRYYSLLKADAMGKSTKKRSFNDMLFAAQTTHPRVSPQTVCAKLDSEDLVEAEDIERTTLCEGFSSDEDACRGQTPWKSDEVSAGASGAKCAWVSSKCQYQKCWEQRWSYAIPLEIIYLTPLSEWNPYNIPYITDTKSTEYAEVTASRDGTIDKPFKYSRKDTFYRTPAALFKDLTNVDAADTSGGSTYVLDASGTKQTVRASGHWIMFPEMDGMNIRQRYPVFPIHEQGSTIWKEVKAVEELIMGKDNDYIKAIIAETRGENYGLVLELTVGSGHTHEIDVSTSELASLKAGTITSIKKVTSLANGHQHYVKLDYDNTATTGEEWSLDWCTQSADKKTCKVTTGCSAATDTPYCCVDSCPDLHSGVKVA